LGRRPIPIGAEIARSTDQEAGKVALGSSATEADAHTFASLRSLQPCVLPFLLSGAAALARGLVRRSRCCSLLIQLEAASFYRRSASPSPLRGHACSLNASAQRTRVRLCQVRCLHMLILAGIMRASQGEKSSFCNVERPQLCRSQPTQLHAQSTSLTATLSPRSTHAHGSECALLTFSHAPNSLIAPSGRAAQKGEY